MPIYVAAMFTLTAMLTVSKHGHVAGAIPLSDGQQMIEGKYAIGSDGSVVRSPVLGHPSSSISPPNISPPHPIGGGGGGGRGGEGGGEGGEGEGGGGEGGEGGGDSVLESHVQYHTHTTYAHDNVHVQQLVMKHVRVLYQLSHTSVNARILSVSLSSVSALCRIKERRKKTGLSNSIVLLREGELTISGVDMIEERSSHECLLVAVTDKSGGMLTSLSRVAVAMSGKEADKEDKEFVVWLGRRRGTLSQPSFDKF